jgi:hypothetical protein
MRELASVQCLCSCGCTWSQTVVDPDDIIEKGPECESVVCGTVEEAKAIFSTDTETEEE